MYFSDNDGSSWSLVNTGVSGNLYIFSIIAKNSMVFASINGSVYSTTDNGLSWLIDSVGVIPYNDLNTLAVNGNDVFAGGQSGVFISHDNGNSWVQSNNGLSNLHVHSFAFSGSKAFTGTEWDGGVSVSVDNGANWVSSNDGLNYNAINSLLVNGAYIYAATDGAGIWKRPLSEMTSITELSASNVNIYPNPASDNITIDVSSSLSTHSTLEILNIQGQTILQQQVQQGKTNINISGLAKGVYILKLSSNDKTEVTRFVKE